MRITGVLGGSFNPIHNAHLAMAKGAHEEYNIPEILIMPTASTYYKDGSVLIDSELRMQMIRLAIEEFSAKDYLTPSYLDLERGGITLTYDTINELRAVYDKIFFLIGADSLMYIEKWVKAEEFLPLCTLLVSLRDSVDKVNVKLKADWLKKHLRADIHFLNTPLIPVSSSVIRKKIADGENVSGMLPDSVLNFIMEHKLYI